MAMAMLIGMAGCALSSSRAIPPLPSDTVSPVTRWLALHAMRLRTVDPDSDPADLEPVAAAIGDARIVVLGEPTHGNREVYQLKHRLFQYLVEARGFTAIVLETPMGETFDVDRYVKGGPGTAEEALAATHVWPWDTEEVAALLRWLREYNRSHANVVSVYGFDMQSVERAAHRTISYLMQVDSGLARATRNSIGHLAIPFSDADAGGYRPVVERDFDSDVQKAVNKLRAAFEDHRDSWSSRTGVDAYAVARQHAALLEQWVRANRHDGKAYGAVRDSAMAENVRWIVAREGANARIAVWTHNAHAADAEATQRGDGSSWAGRYLRQWFQDDLVIVGFLYNRGRFTAIEVADSSRGTIAHAVGPAPDGTMEAVLADAGLRMAAIDLRQLPTSGPVAEWFSEPRRVRYSWGDYSPASPEKYFTSYTLPNAFDMLVYVDSTTPTRLIQPADQATGAVLPAPANLDFEQGEALPDNWMVWSKLKRFGFEIGITSDAYRGNRAIRIHRQAVRQIGEASGNIIQQIDASPYRGKRVRLRVMAKSALEGKGLAFVRLRVRTRRSDRPFDDSPDSFDSLDRVRVVSSGWTEYEIEADVPPEARTISYGIFLAGAGNVWMDDVHLEAE